MKIGDLSAPVTASKADWLAGTSWLGFTPKEDSQDARNKCQGTIQRQYKNGYVIEYITESIEVPNKGFEQDSRYLAERKRHEQLAGRLVAVHRLRTTARPLDVVLGKTEFKRLQDMWAEDIKRCRWSVAFPIIESYDIIERPKAKTVFKEDAYNRLYRHSSAVLRPLNDEERALIASLELRARESTNAWIGIEDEANIAEQSALDSRTRQLIDTDLGAMEGTAEERRAKVRARAAWLAHKFVLDRQKRGELRCDACPFDPTETANRLNIKPRGLLDVHHKNPLDEGQRYTTFRDFALLCPTCHRIEHAIMRSKN